MLRLVPNASAVREALCCRVGSACQSPSCSFWWGALANSALARAVLSGLIRNPWGLAGQVHFGRGQRTHVLFAVCIGDFHGFAGASREPVSKRCPDSRRSTNRRRWCRGQLHSHSGLPATRRSIFLLSSAKAGAALAATAAVTAPRMATVFFDIVFPFGFVIRSASRR